MNNNTATANASNNESFTTTSCSHVAQQELVKLERETVAKLSKALLEWHQQFGPGLDAVFTGLGLMLLEVDKAAGAVESANGSDLEVHTAAVMAMSANLGKPNIPSMRNHQASRIRAMGGKRKAKPTMDYEANTISLIAGDFPAWYDEVGFSGFLASLFQLYKMFDEVFHGYLDDESLEAASVFFLTAFEMRRRLHKIPMELLGAIEMLDKIDKAA